MITVTILTKNSSAYIEEVLESAKAFDEVLVLDTGSTDNTMDLARTYPNVTLHEAEFTGFGPLHNQMVDLARNDWILSLDSDEVLSPELVAEIEKFQLDPGTVYAVSRHNYYNGRFIKCCGWYPDFQYRLFHRDKTRFTDDLVHETVKRDHMRTVKLKGPMKHYSYACTADFLQKMQSYSELFASQNRGKRRSSLSKAIGHGLWTFFKNYLLKKGILGGREGFIISVYNANTAFYKYLKLAEDPQS